MELTHLLIEKHTSSHLRWEASVKCYLCNHCNSLSSLETNYLSNVDDGSMFHVFFCSVVRNAHKTCRSQLIKNVCFLSLLL